MKILKEEKDGEVRPEQDMSSKLEKLHDSYL